MVDKYHLVPHMKDEFTEAFKTLARHEEPFPATRKEKIKDLNKLQPGDHISFYKTNLHYAHHSIVCESRTNYLRVIHYFNTIENMWTTLTKGSIYIAEVIVSEMPVDMNSKSEDLYLHHYDNIPCFSNEETLQRAFSQLGKRGYSLFGNNCEHWARWCRSDEHYSEQIHRFREKVKEKSATLLIVDPTALFVKDIASVGASTFGQFLSAVGSGGILTAVEGVSAYIDIKKKRNQRRNGSLSDVALKKYVVKRITSASGTVVGGTIGTVVGTILIPVPILGATVGGVVGSFGGKFFGGVAGIALSKVVEVYEKKKESKIIEMSTIPQLINNLSPECELVRGLISISMDFEEEEKISNVIQEALTSTTSSLFPLLALLEEIERENPNTKPEKYEVITQLATKLFPDSNSCDYFVLTPIPDNNAPEEFTSSADLLVLRWPMEAMKPWESDGEQVLDIDDLNVNKE